MNYIEKQLLLSSAIKAIDFLGGATSPAERSGRYRFEDEELSATGMDPMQTLDLLHQENEQRRDSLEKMALCMPETVTPALATNWLVSSWNLQRQSKGYINRETISSIRKTTERWLRHLLPVEDDATIHFHPDLMLANFRALIIARDALLRQMNWDINIRGLFNAPSISIVTTSALSEHALAALSLAGFGRSNITFVTTRDDGTLDIEGLPRLHERTILYLQAVHPITGAMENGGVIKLAKAHGAWVHIDAPVTLWMNAASNKKELLAAYQLADSWVTDTSIWFECPEPLGILACRNHTHATKPLFDVPMASDSAVASLWASLRSLGKAGLQSRIARSTVYSDYIAHKLVDTPVEILAGTQACNVLIAFDRESLTKTAYHTLTRANMLDHSLVYWRGKMRIRIPLLSWKQTPEWIETIIAIIKDTTPGSMNLASAS